MKNEVTCRICGGNAEPENPFLTGAIYARNPLTFRMAWMCGDCFSNAIDQIQGLPPFGLNAHLDFESRYDQYLDYCLENDR